MPSSPTSWSDCLAFTSTRCHFTTDQLLGCSTLDSSPTNWSDCSSLHRQLRWGLLGVRSLLLNAHFAANQLVGLPSIFCRHLFCFKSLLNSFATATGLSVNYNKSCLIPLNVPVYKIPHLTGILGCSLGELPFTYLGLP